MGYALPASIGACFAINKRRVICIDGDGSFQLNIQELQTIKEHKLPIKIFLINNCGYGIIRQFQELYLGSRFIGSSAEKGVTNPDFKKIIHGYGINYNKIKKNSEINSVLKNVLKSKKSEFVEIFVDPTQKIFPKLEYGRKLEDLSPLLPREEFFKLNHGLK
jgi:acetolactate synthase-1/2/3 large subunit